MFESTGECYRGVFIGTDDDFLQRAAVRKVFEVNALEPGDAALFDIPDEVLVQEGITLPTTTTPTTTPSPNPHASTSLESLSHTDPYDEDYLPAYPATTTTHLGTHHGGTSTFSLILPNPQAVAFVIVRHRFKLLVMYLIVAGVVTRFSAATPMGLWTAVGVSVLVFVGILVAMYVRRRKREVEREVPVGDEYI
ncbi:hypothetical protein HK104_003925 [Borealophlyctis nickersoniae]|nr:hypothetical protein HK104_003925 [Borealophlyctis nickersoniae]